MNKRNVKELGTEQFAELDAKVLQSQKALGNDLVVLVWTDTLVYKRELGELDSKTAVPIGNSSGWLTTALILQLVDEGKLSLDDKIADYLPGYARYGKKYITLRHCLTNFTGIEAAESVSLRNLSWRKKYASLDEEVNGFAREEIQANPGTEFRYSNMGLNIAARIAEIVSKKKFEMLIKQKLLNPLGMRQTSFATLDGSAPNPAAGAVSSANDYLQFLKMLLHNGVYNGQRILSEEAVKEMRTIQTKEGQIKEAPKAAAGFAYAAGSWALEASGNEATVLSSIGLFGAWPEVDWCRRSVRLVLTKTLLNEPKREIYLQMKEAIDGRLQSTCK